MSGVKMYARWINCVGGECPESNKGKCQRAMYERGDRSVYGFPAEFPADGKCLFPHFLPYDPDWADAGVYETEL